MCWYSSVLLVSRGTFGGLLEAAEEEPGLRIPISMGSDSPFGCLFRAASGIHSPSPRGNHSPPRYVGLPTLWGYGTRNLYLLHAIRLPQPVMLVYVQP